MKKTLMRTALLATLLVLGTAGCSWSLAQDITPPPGLQQPAPVQEVTLLTDAFPLSAPDLNNGAAIFAQSCLPCHGETGLGDGPQSGNLPVPAAPIGSAELADSKTPQEWFSIVSLGKLDSFMPPFLNSLSEQDRWDVVGFVYALSVPVDVVMQGETIYAENCAACHGTNGKGDGEPNVEAADLTNSELMVTLSNEDIFAVITDGLESVPVHKFDGLSEFDRWAAVYMVRTFTFPIAEQTDLQALLEEPATPEPTGPEPASPVTEGTPEVEETPAAEAPVEEVPTTPTGTFGGLVMNDSTGKPAGDLPITLHGYDHIEEVLTIEGKVNARGEFIFEGVELVPNRLFFVTLEYNGMTFGSDFIIPIEGETVIDMPVSIYETTSSTENISIQRVHIFFEFTEPDLVQVIELAVIVNNGTEAVVGEREFDPVLTFPLPEGYQDLAFEDGSLGDGRYVQTTTGFGDTLALLPGDSGRQLLFAYTLPYTRNLDFTQIFSLDVDSALVFMPEGNLKLKGDEFVDGGIQDLNGLPFRMYSGNGLAAGEALSFELSGRNPANGSGFSLTNDTTSLLIGFGGLIIAVAAVLFWRKSRTDEDHDDYDDEESAEELMDAIIALDEAFEAGEIKEKAYINERSALKEKLKELVD